MSIIPVHVKSEMIYGLASEQNLPPAIKPPQDLHL